LIKISLPFVRRPQLRRKPAKANESSVGSIEGKSGQTWHKTCVVLPWNLISGLFGHVCFFLSSCASFFVSFFIYYCPCGLYCISYGL
jgi:hypothetical protein